MKIFKLFYITFFFFSATVLGLTFSREKKNTGISIPQGEINSQSPPCIQMYYYIEKYAEEYDIPKKYAYGIARQETGYHNAFQWNYDHAQTSSAGAVGPMQVMFTTAQMMWPEEEFDRDKLKNDIEFNVKTSMKLLRHLHDKYRDWKVVFGAYNTGKPLVNGYAMNVFNHKL
jgi:soluble lytic murein transglycosylase-like protein